jgi:hypothetical protein
VPAQPFQHSTEPSDQPSPAHHLLTYGWRGAVRCGAVRRCVAVLGSRGWRMLQRHSRPHCERTFGPVCRCERASTTATATATATTDTLTLGYEVDAQALTSCVRFRAWMRGCRRLRCESSWSGSRRQRRWFSTLSTNCESALPRRTVLRCSHLWIGRLCSFVFFCQFDRCHVAE